MNYRVADQFVHAVDCHCSECRRTTGSAFKPFAATESGKLSIVQGADQMMRFGDENAIPLPPEKRFQGKRRRRKTVPSIGVL